jgi:hypothetical protein
MSRPLFSKFYLALLVVPFAFSPFRPLPLQLALVEYLYILPSMSPF